ncbi:hypothetical protein ACVIIW_007164 [Bradyrhizobium sp. USDA 4449]
MLWRNPVENSRQGWRDERAGHHRRLHCMEFIRWDRGSWSLGIDVKKLDLISAPILIE